MKLDYFRYANGDVDVYYKINNAWVLWALVRDSALLASIGARGKGLFAAQSFSKGECIGRYVGKILGKVDNPDVMTQVDRLSHTLDGDAIVDVKGYFVNGRARVQANAEQQERFGTVIFRQPQWKWPGVYAHICNDAAGTTLRNNCRVTVGGYLETTRSIPGFDFLRDAAQNGASELLWDYGTQYWRNQRRLGSSALPIVIE